MGSFNVTCCVTKTPILEREDCVLVIFNNPNKKFLIDSSNAFELVFEDSIKDIFFGKYADYGNIDSCSYSVNDNRENKFIGFFFSKDAWEFGKTLTSLMYFAERKIKTAKEFIELFELNKEKIDLKCDLETKQLIKKLEKWVRYENEVKIIFALKWFCSNNHFNIFDTSFDNHYAGQQINTDDYTTWEKLRKQRIKKLK